MWGVGKMFRWRGPAGHDWCGRHGAGGQWGWKVPRAGRAPGPGHRAWLPARQMQALCPAWLWAPPGHACSQTPPCSFYQRRAQATPAMDGFVGRKASLRLGHPAFAQVYPTWEGMPKIGTGIEPAGRCAAGEACGFAVCRKGRVFYTTRRFCAVSLTREMCVGGWG